MVKKIGTPRPDETFDDLFARARMVEECERQFTASAESRPPNKHGKSNPKPKQAPKESEGNTSNSINQGEGSRSSRPPKQVRCFQCKQLGHRRNECPKRLEATGHNTSNTAVRTRLKVLMLHTSLWNSWSNY